MKKSITINFNPLYALIMMCLFCTTLNIFNRYFIFLFMAVVVFCLYTQRIVANHSVLLLMIYAVSLLLMAPTFNTSVFALLKPFLVPFSFIIGYGIFAKEYVSASNEKKFNSAITLLVVLAAGGLVHYLLNWSINLDVTDRQTKDFWSGEVLMPTNQAAMACLALGVSMATLLSRPKLRYWLMAAAALLAILGYNMILSGRTLILMTLIALLVAVLYSMRNNRRGRAILLVSVVLFAVAAVWAYNANAFGLRSFIEESALFGRFTGEYGQELSEDTRLDNKMGYLRDMINYPFGGAHLREMYGYAHDLFLDSFDEAGWIAGLAIVIYVCVSVVRLFKFLKRKHIPFMVRQLFLCTYLVVYMEFFVEPVLQASPWLLSGFCALDGCVCAMLRVKPEQVELPESEM